MGVVTIAYVIYSESLQHEGILGMKWGRRNGPPYPLKDGAHSAAEQKANPELAKRAEKAAKEKGSVVKYARNPRRYSDDEIKSRIERLKSDETYRELTGRLTKKEAKEIRRLIATNLAGVMTKELPTGVIATGRSVWEFQKTFWGKVTLAVAGNLSKEIAPIVKEAISDQREESKQRREERKKRLDELEKAVASTADVFDDAGESDNKTPRKYRKAGRNRREQEKWLI